MPRSLAATEIGKRLIQKALDSKRWTAEDLSHQVAHGDYQETVSRATAYNFCSGNNVRPGKFKAMCWVLGLNWETIAGLESLPTNDDTHRPLAPNLEVVKSGKIKTTFSEVDEQQIRSHCRERIFDQYSKIRLLSGQEIGIDQLYVDVWVLDRPPHTLMMSQQKMLETFDLRKDRLGLGDRIRRDPGFNVANEKTKLLILGKPGSGKTTFLKHIAFDWYNKKFHPNLIAVFIEFRRIRNEKWRLLKAIGDELSLREERPVTRSICK